MKNIFVLFTYFLTFAAPVFAQNLIIMAGTGGDLIEPESQKVIVSFKKGQNNLTLKPGTYPYTIQFGPLFTPVEKPLVVSATTKKYLYVNCHQGMWVTNFEGSRLAVAAAACDLTAIQQAIAAGEKANQPDQYGVTPLYLALINPAYPWYLQFAGANPSEESSPAEREEATKKLAEQRTVVKFLLDNGANPNAFDSVGTTPLFQALQTGYGCNGEMAKLLLNKGANPNLPSKQGVPPLNAAMNYPEYDLINLFFLKGAKAAATDSAGNNALHALAAGSSSNASSEAIGKIVKLLIEKGVDPKAKNAEGNTPFQIAASNNAEVAAALGAAGAIDINGKDAESNTPLMNLARSENGSKMESFLKQGADPNLTNNNGETALLKSANSGYAENVKALIAGKADVNLADKSGVTPLMMACRQNKDDCVALLIAAGANLNLKDKNGKTALFYAVNTYSTNNGTKSLEKLLAAKPDLNIQDANGYTALTNGILLSSNPQFVEALLVAGADPSIATFKGATAESLAVGKPAILALLAKYKK